MKVLGILLMLISVIGIIYSTHIACKGEDINKSLIIAFVSCVLIFLSTHLLD